MRRMLLGGATIVWPRTLYAQQPKSTPPKRIGVLSLFGCPIPSDSPFARRLGELGWAEGRTFVFERVSTVGRLDQVPALAHELLSRHPDVLTAAPIALVRGLMQETKTIPIVMLSTPDPVRLGIITNLARPEGNVTGIAWFGFDILAKRIEILKEIVPHLRRLAFIGDAHAPPETYEIIEGNATIAANRLGFAWQLLKPTAANDYDDIFARLAAEQFDAAYILSAPLSNQNVTRITELALRHRMPAVAESSTWAKAGLLLAYGQNFFHDLARAAEYVDKILRGVKPGELPVEQATKLELVINLKTAKALDLTIPPSLLARADEVIE